MSHADGMAAMCDGRAVCAMIAVPVSLLQCVVQRVWPFQFANKSPRLVFD